VLGPIRDATYTEDQVRLEPGDILVMYTDGLVEGRGWDIETGISKAQQLIEGWGSETTLAQGCRQLTETLASPPRRDDVCVLIVRLRAAEPG
jgi:serine phosphatase RsbU (regulator of sigma subunit)